MNASDKTDPESRRRGRVRCEYLLCFHDEEKFGYVLDLSGTGMRVFRKGWTNLQIHDEVNFVLQWQKTQVPVHAHVVWMNKRGYRKFEFGFKFLDIKPPTASSISRLAHVASESLTIAESHFAGR